MTTTDDAELSVEDRLEILELFARYSWAFDTGDADAYASVFTEDGVMEGGSKRIAGRDELRAFVRRLWDPAVATQHWTTNHLLSGSSAACTSTCYLVEVESTDAQAHVALVGCYRDDLVREPDGWHIAHRRFSPWEQRATIL